MSVRLVTIFGFAPEPPGMRDFALEMAAKYGLQTVFYTYEDPIEKPELLDGSTLLFWAHSFGVDAALKTIQWIVGQMSIPGQQIDLIAMDGVPRGLAWFMPWIKFEVPDIVSTAVFFTGGVGRAAKWAPDVTNVQLHLGIGGWLAHPLFPGNPEVQASTERLIQSETN